MRQRKSTNNKAQLLTASSPASLINYVKEGNIPGIGPSDIFQRSVALCVTGCTLQDFEDLYHPGKPGHDDQFKPEQVSKLYVRAARWILESRIECAEIRGGSLYLSVTWLHSGERTTCVVTSVFQGCRRVVYDALATCIPENDILGGDRTEFNNFLLTLNPTKARIVGNWVRHAYGRK